MKDRVGVEPRASVIVTIGNGKPRRTLFRYLDTARADAKKWIANAERNDLREVEVLDWNGKRILRWTAGQS